MGTAGTVDAEPGHRCASAAPVVRGWRSRRGIERRLRRGNEWCSGRRDEHCGDGGRDCRSDVGSATGACYSAATSAAVRDVWCRVGECFPGRHIAAWYVAAGRLVAGVAGSAASRVVVGRVGCADGCRAGDGWGGGTVGSVDVDVRAGRVPVECWCWCGFGCWIVVFCYRPLLGIGYVGIGCYVRIGF